MPASFFVIPDLVGNLFFCWLWIPASAGMTEEQKGMTEEQKGMPLCPPECVILNLFQDPCLLTYLCPPGPVCRQGRFISGSISYYCGY